MKTDQNPTDCDTEWDQILVECVEAHDTNGQVDRQALLSRHPQHHAKLLELFADFDHLESKTGELKAALRNVADANFAAALAMSSQGPASFPTVRGYKILEMLACGGMGIVYKAEQSTGVGPEHSSRLVALKMLRGSPGSQVDEQRFRREAKIIAQLDHSNIVPIYDVGEAEGRPFFSMKLMEGSLASGVGQDPRKAATLTVQVARAVHHAHLHGILHRDLKPANILLGRDGVPYVSDFGLARHVADDSDLTRGDMLGTPAYMAPEQATKSAGALTTAVDVYGIGAVLHFLLTGEPPFRGPTFAATLDQVREQPPASLTKLHPGLHRDLEAICLKCLQKNPARRYASALELAEDLERWLREEITIARPAGWIEHAWQSARRHPKLLIAIVVAIALAAVLVERVITEDRIHTREAIADAEQKQKAAEERANHARKLLLVQEIQQLRLTHHKNGWSQQCLGRVAQAMKLGDDTAWRDQAAATLLGVDATLLHKNDGDFAGLAIDATGDRILLTGKVETRLRHLATGDESVVKVSGGGPAIFDEQGNPLQLVMHAGLKLDLWNVETQRSVAEFSLQAPPGEKTEEWRITEMAVSPRADFVAASARASGAKHLFAVWEVKTGKAILRTETAVDAVAFSRRGPWIAVAGPDETAIYVLPLGDKAASLRTGRGPVGSLAFGRNFTRTAESNYSSEFLAVGQAGGIISIWDLSRGVPTSFCRGSNYDVSALAFSQDGATLASAGRTSAKLWDVATGRSLLDIGDRNTMTDIAFFQNDRKLAISSINAFGQLGGVDIWQLESGRGLDSLRGLNGQIAQVRFSPDDKHVAALAHNWQVGIWSMPDGRLEHVLEVPQGLTADNAAFAFSGDGKQFAFCSGEQAKLWDLNTGAERKSWRLPPGHGDQIGFHGDKLVLFRVEKKDLHSDKSLLFQPNGKPFVGRFRDLLREAGVEPIRELTEIRINHSEMSPDGSYFVVRGHGAHKKPIIVAFDSATGNELWTKPLPEGDVLSLKTDPTGKLMTYAAGLAKEGVELIEMPEGKLLPKPLPARVTCLSPAAHYFAAARDDGYHLHRRDDEAPVVILGLGEQSATVHAEFDPSGARLAWGTIDGAVIVCEIEEVRRRLNELKLGWKERF